MKCSHQEPEGSLLGGGRGTRAYEETLEPLHRLQGKLDHAGRGNVEGLETGGERQAPFEYPPPLEGQVRQIVLERTVAGAGVEAVPEHAPGDRFEPGRGVHRSANGGDEAKKRMPAGPGGSGGLDQDLLAGHRSPDTLGGEDPIECVARVGGTIVERSAKPIKCGPGLGE